MRIRSAVAGVALLAAMIAVPLTAPTALAATLPLKVLVVGDSYSAGNGAGAYYGPQDCYRSKKNYAEMFAATLRAAPYRQPVDVTNAACSGAVTADFGRKDKRGRAPQFNSVTTGYDIVFLSIGGNDAGFEHIVKQCLVAKTRSGRDCDSDLKVAEKMVADGTLGTRLRSVLDGIRLRTKPYATIVLLGYPHLEGDENWVLSYQRAGKKVTVAVGKRLRALSNRGEAIAAATVGDLNKGHSTPPFVYASTHKLFNGPPYHGLYAAKTNKDRWMVQPSVDASPITIPTYYHPNPTGWAEEGKMLATKTPGIPRSKTTPVATGGDLPAGVAGSPYTAKLATADGREGTWSVTSGAVPPGLALTGDTISGRPTAPGTVTLGLRFTDTFGLTATANRKLVISPSVPNDQWVVQALADPAQATAAGPLSCGGPACAGSVGYRTADGQNLWQLTQTVGGQWRTVAPPRLAGGSAPAQYVGETRCNGTGECVASGSDADGKEAVWAFTGGAWTVTSPTAPPDSRWASGAPRHLACGLTTCVGLSNYIPAGSNDKVPVLATWRRSDGWRVIPAPFPAGAGGQYGTGAVQSACGPDICVIATDYTGTDGVARQLFWTWRAPTGWTVHSASVPDGFTTDGGYTYVACGPVGCAAIGGSWSDDREHFRDVLWSWQLSSGWSPGSFAPVPPGADDSNGHLQLNCGSAMCAAGGLYWTAGRADLGYLVWTWTPAAGWRATTPAFTPRYSSGCAGDTCSVIGEYRTADRSTVTGVWTTTDGATWSLGAEPVASTSTTSPMVDLACGPGRCAAIISTNSSDPAQRYGKLMHWTAGTGWVATAADLLPAGAAEGQAPYLSSTSCGTDLCAASGSYIPAGATDTTRPAFWTHW